MLMLDALKLFRASPSFPPSPLVGRERHKKNCAIVRGVRRRKSPNRIPDVQGKRASGELGLVPRAAQLWIVLEAGGRAPQGSTDYAVRAGANRRWQRLSRCFSAFRPLQHDHQTSSLPIYHQNSSTPRDDPTNDQPDNDTTTAIDENPSRLPPSIELQLILSTPGTPSHRRRASPLRIRQDGECAI